MSEAISIIRDEVLSQFPEIATSDLNLRPGAVMEDFIMPAKVSKSLISYLVKMEQVENWTFANQAASKDDKMLVQEMETELVQMLRPLAGHTEWERQTRLLEQLNWLLARLSTMQCLYVVKFLSQSGSNYLEQLDGSEDNNAKLLKDRLLSAHKAMKLTRVFSSEVLDRIINVLRNSENGKRKI